MEQPVSTYNYPTTTAADDTTFQNIHTPQPAFQVWGNGYGPYTVNYHMDWMSSNHGHYDLHGQDYLAVQQHSFSDPLDNTSQQHSLSQTSQPPQLEVTPTSAYPSEVYACSVSSAPTQSSHDALMPLDNTGLDRPQSADTMLDSGSSPVSRRSSINSSPANRGQKNKVPAITTHFGNQSTPNPNHTPLGDGFQVAPDTDSMTALSNEWMSVHDPTTQNDLHHQPLSAVTLKNSPALLEPFQWTSPVTRRPSVTSIASGSMFSSNDTPGSTVWYPSNVNSPYSRQQDWAPVSNLNYYAGSPQSPNQPRTNRTWNHAQYAKAMRQFRHVKPTALSLPGRGKLPNGRNAIDMYAASPNPQAQLGARSRVVGLKGRPRAESNPQYLSQQMALPEFRLGALFASPDVTQSGFLGLIPEPQTPTRNILPSSTTHTPMLPPQSTPRTTMTPNFNSLHLNTPLACSQPFAHTPANLPSSTTNVSPITTPAHQPPLPVPSDPPLSDFLATSNGSSTSPTGHSHNHPPPCAPIRQSPHFEGDIYTPRYKRRNAAGKWEGWCGYCQPGRWLDLKNSRYWEDKLRNHGICARTKTFFEGPVRVRWISDRGTIWEGQAGDSGFDLAGKEGVDDDGIGRKREGLCGECNTWVGMDGMRSRGKGRCVAWWMHAYKCHEQSRSRTEGNGNFEQT